MEVSTDGPDQSENREGRKSAPLIESAEEAGKQRRYLGQTEGLEEDKRIPGGR